MTLIIKCIHCFFLLWTLALNIWPEHFISFLFEKKWSHEEECLWVTVWESWSSHPSPLYLSLFSPLPPSPALLSCFPKVSPRWPLCSLCAGQQGPGAGHHPSKPFGSWGQAAGRQPRSQWREAEVCPEERVCLVGASTQLAGSSWLCLVFTITCPFWQLHVSSWPPAEVGMDIHDASTHMSF